MSNHQPELPTAFNLVTLNDVESLRTYANKMAVEGAEEGTVYWAQDQSNAQGHFNKTWHCAPGDLHCSIVLQPEFAIEQFGELYLVAMISMGNALATHLTAMTALSYKWPNALCIANHKISGIWVDANSNKDSPWMTITSSVNIKNSPEDFSIAAMSIAEAEGTTDLNANTLLETYARQFITQINNWADQGVNSICKQWRLRAEGLGEEFSIQLKNRQIVGIWETINEDGSIDIRNDEGSIIHVNLNDFISWID